jgi:hypothetical protein
VVAPDGEVLIKVIGSWAADIACSNLIDSNPVRSETAKVVFVPSSRPSRSHENRLCFGHQLCMIGFKTSLSARHPQ